MLINIQQAPSFSLDSLTAWIIQIVICHDSWTVFLYLTILDHLWYRNKYAPGAQVDVMTDQGASRNITPAISIKKSRGWS